MHLSLGRSKKLNQLSLDKRGEFYLKEDMVDMDKKVNPEYERIYEMIENCQDYTDYEEIEGRIFFNSELSAEEIEELREANMDWNHEHLQKANDDKDWQEMLLFNPDLRD